MKIFHFSVCSNICVCVCVCDVPSLIVCLHYSIQPNRDFSFLLGGVWQKSHRSHTAKGRPCTKSLVYPTTDRQEWWTGTVFFKCNFSRTVAKLNIPFVFHVFSCCLSFFCSLFFFLFSSWIVLILIVLTPGWITAIKAARGYKVKRPCTRLLRHRRRQTPGPGLRVLQLRQALCPAGAPWGVCPIFFVLLAPAFGNDDENQWLTIEQKAEPQTSLHFLSGALCVQQQKMIKTKRFFYVPSCSPFLLNR